MRKLIYFFIFLFFPYVSFANTYLLSFNNENKNLFYLQNTVIENQGASIVKSDSLLQNDPYNKYIFVSFEKNLQNESSNVPLMYDSTRNKKTGLFFNNKSYVELKYYGNFRTGVVIDFWAKPFSTNLGQVFSSQFLSSDAYSKHFQIYFEKGRIHVKFANLFISPQDISKNESISISSRSIITPNTWTHHTLIYNPNTGKITYSLNGKVDAEIWATQTHMPDGPLYVLSLPEESQFFLGRGFRGLIDNFFLSSDITKTMSEQIFDKEEGYIHTRVLQLPSECVVNKIDLNSLLPKDTGYKIEYRIANMPFSDDTPEDLVPWTEYNQLHPSKNPTIKGHYIQARITLFSDPVQSESPIIKQLVLNYTPLESPMPPIDVQAVSSNSDLIVSFKTVQNKTISAYHLYLGKKPGEYFGDDDNAIKSPVLIPITALKFDASTDRYVYVIHNLSPYKLYFLRVTSLTVEGVESSMSPEVSTRIRKLE